MIKIKSLIVSSKEQGKAKAFLVPYNCDNNFKLNQLSFGITVILARYLFRLYIFTLLTENIFKAHSNLTELKIWLKEVCSYYQIIHNPKNIKINFYHNYLDVLIVTPSFITNLSKILYSHHFFRFSAITKSSWKLWPLIYLSD